MQKNVASQKIYVFAFDRTDNTPVTGDAANITANIQLDGGSSDAITDTNPTEFEEGYYIFDVTKAETNGASILVSPSSITADVQVIGVPGVIVTTPQGTTTGTNTVTITINDGTNPIADVAVQIWNSDSSVFITSDSTNASGIANLTADDGTYKVKIRKSGYSFDLEDLTVAGDTADTYSGTSYTVSAPIDPDMCRVYEYLKNADRTIPATVTGDMSIIKLPYDYTDTIFSGEVLNGTYSAVTGLIYWDVVRLSTVSVLISEFGINQEVIVPDSSTVRLLDI